MKQLSFVIFLSTAAFYSLPAMEENPKQDLSCPAGMVEKAWQEFLDPSQHWLFAEHTSKKNNNSIRIALSKDIKQTCICTVYCNEKRVASRNRLNSKEETLQFIEEWIERL